MTHAALYARVSTEDQAERYGLGAQLTELRARAAEKGYTLAGEYVDQTSGATLERPALDREREALQTGGIQVLLALSPDRLSRRLVHQLLLTEEIRRAGVRLEYLTLEVVDSPEGRLLEHVTATIAEYERELIRSRTQRGRREALRRGRLVGGSPPYGYRWAPGTVGVLAIAPAEAAIVRRIFAALARGTVSLRALARQLTTDEVPTPRGRPAWRPSTLAGIAANPTYAGTAYWGESERLVRRRLTPVERAQGQLTRRARAAREVIAVSVPAIITPARAAQVRAHLQRNADLLVGRPPRALVVLRGILHCPCGRRLVHTSAGTGRRWARYSRCTSRASAPTPCGAGAVRAARLEALIWDTVRRRLRDSAALAVAVDRHQLRVDVQAIEAESAVGHARRRLAQIERAQARLVEALADGEDASPTVLLRGKLQVLEAERRALRDDLARAAATPPAPPPESLASLRSAYARAVSASTAVAPAARQALYRRLGLRIVVQPQSLELTGLLIGTAAPSAPPTASGLSSRPAPPPGPFTGPARPLVVARP